MQTSGALNRLWNDSARILWIHCLKFLQFQPINSQSHRMCERCQFRAAFYHFTNNLKKKKKQRKNNSQHFITNRKKKKPNGIFWMKTQNTIWHDTRCDATRRDETKRDSRSYTSSKCFSNENLSFVTLWFKHCFGQSAGNSQQSALYIWNVTH